jgi:hypothetical protein
LQKNKKVEKIISRNIRRGSMSAEADEAGVGAHRPTAAEVVVPVRAQRSGGARRAMAAVASGALLVLAVVGIVALLGGGGPGSAGEAPLELESMAKQRHFHRVFQKLEKKPSSGDVARAARERKHAIASMSPQQARNVLVKWGFLPPAQGASTSTRQALKQVAAHHRSGDARAPKDGAPGSRSAEFARLRREASDDDMRPRRPDRTDERDEDADSRAVERDREIANRAKSAREAAREREAAHEGEKRGDGRGEAPHGDARAHGDDRTRRASEHERRLDGQRAEHAARATGFDHLEDVAMGLATAVHDDQEGILHEKKKLTSDRNKLLQTRELIDKALSHLAEKSREPRVDRDSADFTIKVRGDEQQRQLAEQSERAQTRDYWKIPIRPGEERAREAPAQQDSQWAHIRRRRAPDARANAGADAGTLYPVDPLALEEAASADGLQVMDVVCTQGVGTQGVVEYVLKGHAVKG